MNTAMKRYIITGGDISLPMVKKSRENARKMDVFDRTSFRVLDAEKIDYRKNSFDAVISLRFLGHTPPNVRMKILKEFRRVGKKYFIFVYYLKGSFQEVLRRSRRSVVGSPWYPVSFEDIDREMKQSDIKKIKIIPILRGFSETVVVVGEASS